MARHTEFELWQDGQCVAIVGCEKPADAVRSILHYAAVYGQDGPVEIKSPSGDYELLAQTVRSHLPS